MLTFKICIDEQTGEKYIKTSLSGKPLLTTPQLNKGTAFTKEERESFGLNGKLPYQVESLDEQVKRAYSQYLAYSSKLKRNIYLNNLNDKNQVLFYKLVSTHLDEMLPTIYTPIVGTAVKRYSHEFRQPRGIYISYKDQDNIEQILNNRSNPEIDLIVTTDGEGVLGIGDQGIGGMDIPVAKLMVYSLCGGIDPCRTLPIFLDVGTNNQELLDDPMYLGWRHKRVKGEKYDEFITKFVTAITKCFNKVFLHWEDFGRENANRILNRFEKTICSFNDDIQGTGIVTLAALLAAIHLNKSTLKEQRIVVFGAGSAGSGISQQIAEAITREGGSLEQAYQQFWLVDKQGLLINGDQSLTEQQKIFARNPKELENWQLANPQKITLSDVIKNVKPNVLIGTSSQTGAFTQDIIQSMLKHCARPIIFPLSNPTEKCEATPHDLINWTKGQALIATGTAFEPVEYENKIYPIAQCNNALAFPGIGLAIIAIGANYLSRDMIWQASIALNIHSPCITDPLAPLLPSLSNSEDIAHSIALKVAHQGIKEGAATKNQNEDLKDIINNIYWKPRYLPFRKG